MLNVTINSGTTATIREEVLSVLNDCVALAQGRRSIGCSALSFAQTLQIDGQMVDRLTLSGLLTADYCDVLASLTERFPRLPAAFGCEDGQSHVLWNHALDTRAEPAACVLYLPYVLDASVEGGTRWAVWLGPCDQAKDATF